MLRPTRRTCHSLHAQNLWGGELTQNGQTGSLFDWPRLVRPAQTGFYMILADATAWLDKVGIE
jgi:hypothetical protein